MNDVRKMVYSPYPLPASGPYEVEPGLTDGPSADVLRKPAKDDDELLKVRAWEVKRSPVDLGYSLVKDWPKPLPKGMKFGFTIPTGVTSASADSKGNYYVYQRGPDAPALLCFDRQGNQLDPGVKVK